LGVVALFQAVLALVSGGGQQPEPPLLATLTPRQKAALVVVSGLPAPKGVAGVLVQGWSRNEPRPRRAILFVDQEGGSASTFDELPPGRSAASFPSRRAAFRAGSDTGGALRKTGGDWVDLAPVLDLAGGPLGSRHFATPAYGLAFARGLGAGGSTACVKHFPGLGSAPISTDESPHVHARLLPAELQAFRSAVKSGVRCVMVGHAFYGGLGAARRASFNPAAYRLLRRQGFEGVAITDSISVFGSDWAVRAARLSVSAGADLVLLTSGPDASRVVRALVPLARRGLLDEHVARVLAFRRSVGLPEVP
jgi:beta-N-acetylhexosaminidase